MKSASIKFLAALAALLFAVSECPAKVLIYKGTLRLASDTSSSFPKSFRTFLVFDPDKSLVASVSTFQADGRKIQLPSPPSDIRFAQASLPDGKSATIISRAFINGGSNDFFENICIHFRGVNKTLKFNSGVFGDSVTFPRLISGIVLDDEAFNGVGAFIEQRMLLTYQESRSVSANDASQTVQQVIDLLVAELKAKGFEAPAP
jgi:hypothetical protein